MWKKRLPFPAFGHFQHPHNTPAPVYDAYKKIVQKIIDDKLYKEYAEAEIDDLIQSITGTFKEIKEIMLVQKDWKNI